MRRLAQIWIKLKLSTGKITTFIKKYLNKDVVIFLVFVLLSVCFWVLQTMQDTTEFEISVPVKYNDISDRYVITNNLPSTLNVTLRDKGTTIYYYYRHKKELSLDIDPMEWYSDNGYGKIPSGVLESRIRYRLKSSTQILKLKPDTISFLFVKKVSKTVPVVVKSNITLAPQYMLTKKPVINPSSVVIFAPSYILSGIDSVYTKNIEFKDLKDTATYSVRLEDVEGVSFHDNRVKVTYYVEEFTEKSLMVPVKGLGFPANQFLLSFPSEVKISFFVGLSDYSDIKETDFQVSVSYEDLINSKSKIQKVRLTKYPAMVRNIRVSPEEVDCLIEKK